MIGRKLKSVKKFIENISDTDYIDEIIAKAMNHKYYLIRKWKNSNEDEKTKERVIRYIENSYKGCDGKGTEHLIKLHGRNKYHAGYSWIMQKGWLRMGIKEKIKLIKEGY